MCIPGPIASRLAVDTIEEIIESLTRRSGASGFKHADLAGALERKLGRSFEAAEVTLLYRALGKEAPQPGIGKGSAAPRAGEAPDAAADEAKRGTWTLAAEPAAPAAASAGPAAARAASSSTPGPGS